MGKLDAGRKVRYLGYVPMTMTHEQIGNIRVPERTRHR
jgi:hypothetical protein